MQKDKIIKKGDVAKYQLTITHDDFDQQVDNFFIILHYGMKGGTLRIDKEQMVNENRSRWLFSISSAEMSFGMVKAETHYFVGDSDYEGGVREVVEWLCLGFITDSPCPRFACNCRCECCESCVAEHVDIRREYNSSPYVYLRTVEGEPICDSDGHRLRVLDENKVTIK